MSQTTSIGWCDRTWNPWWGCTKVSDECRHCYIQINMRRRGLEPFGGPMRTSAATWQAPLRWNKIAAEAGVRHRVFTCSMSDFFHPDADPWRADAWPVLSECRSLDWLVLTKRPELVAERLPADWGAGYANVWLGVTVGCSASLARLDLLHQIPAKLKWVSVEPLLELLDLRPYLSWLAWVVTGCESAGRDKRRLMDIAWVKDLDEQCREFGVAHYFKQQYVNNKGRPSHQPLLDGRIVQDFPATACSEPLAAGTATASGPQQSDAPRVSGQAASPLEQTARNQRRPSEAASVVRQDFTNTGADVAPILVEANMPDGFVRLSDQTCDSETEWLWNDRIPFGAVTTLEGDPGTNKSTLAYYLAAGLTVGRRIYRNPQLIDGGAVLLQGEESSSRLRRSLVLREADLDRVCVVDSSTQGDSRVMLPDGMDKLKRAVESVDAKLVVIDPVDEFFDGSLANDDFARRAITPLSELARSKNLAIVLVRHLTKTGTSRALYRGRGSIRLAGAARSTLLLAQDPLDTGRRILAQSKSSLGPQAPSLAFELVDRNGYPTIHWLGESPISADDLVQGGGPHDGPMLREAMQSLVRILADDKLLVKDAKQLLRDADVSDTTSRRARRRLGICTEAESSGPQSKHYWCLPQESEEVERIRCQLNLSA